MNSNIFRNLFALILIFSTAVQAETNVRVAPISALAGVADVTLDFKIAESWTLGPTAQYLNRRFEGFDAEALVLGVRGNYYFERSAFTQGWYLGPTLSYMDISVEDDDSLGGTTEGSTTGVALTVFGGYQWMWESFNINLGLGPVYYSMSEIEVKDSNGDTESFDNYNGLSLALEFTLGWKF